MNGKIPSKFNEDEENNEDEELVDYVDEDDEEIVDYIEEDEDNNQENK